MGIRFYDLPIVLNTNILVSVSFCLLYRYRYYDRHCQLEIKLEKILFFKSTKNIVNNNKY